MDRRAELGKKLIQKQLMKQLAKVGGTVAKKLGLGSLLGILPYILVVVVIVVVIMGPAVMIKEKYDSFLAGVEDFFTLPSQRNMQAMIDTIGEEAYESLPVDKKVLKKILDAEERTYLSDVTIKAPIKIEREYEKKILVEEEVDGKKTLVEKVIIEKDIKWDYYTDTINLYDISYEFRTPWQLLYALAVIGGYKSNIEDLAQMYEEKGYSTEDQMFYVDLKRLDNAIEALKPSFDFSINLDKLKDGKKYSYEEYIELSKNILERDISTTTNEDGDKITRTKYYINVYPQAITGFADIKTFHYKQKIEYGKVRLVTDYVDHKVNYEKFRAAMEEMGYTESDIAYVMLFLEQMPDGEAVMYKMGPIASEYGIQGYGTFNASLPVVVGDVNRKDVIDMAEALLGLWYFYGGKYPAYGLSPDWGSMRMQPHEDSSHHGKVYAYGLDCSGYVDWVYYQLYGDVLGRGGGVRSQYAYCEKIGIEELRPGDLGFAASDGGEHIGIYWGEIDGVPAFLHASGNTRDQAHPYGQVMLSKLNESYNGYPGVDFKYFGRVPYQFADDYLFGGDIDER